MKWEAYGSIPGMYYCSKCDGLAPDPGYRFCPHCGEKAKEPPGARFVNGEWIPTDEKLPRNTNSENADDIKQYMISYRREGKVEVHIAFFTDGKWFWHIGNPVGYDVIAWAKIPEPYKTWEDIENGS